MPNQDAGLFTVGGRYENRRGPFEVLSIQGETMCIRWDDGLETSTSIPDQTRIMCNMERDLLAGTEGRTKRWKVPSWFGESFTGVGEGDFSEDVSGTHWRSRERLGGAVTKGLAVKEPFNSWAPYRRPQIHWSSLKRHAAVDSHYQAKFFARMWPQHLAFGLYVERPDDPTKEQADWQRFTQWLATMNNGEWLRALLEEHGAIIQQPYDNGKPRAFEGKLTPTKAGFDYAVDGETRLMPPTELGPFLASLRPDWWIDLVIEKRVEKAEAISQGPKVAKTIYDFLNVLMPVFENGVPPRK